MSSPSRFGRAFISFLPFWIFLLLFKFGGGLHFSLMAPYGESLLPIWVVGLIMGGASLLQLLLDVPAGHLLDRYGYRRLLKISATTFFFAALCLFFEFTLGTYLLSVLLSVFAWLFFGPGANAYLLSSAKKEYAGRFMSLKDVFMSVGIVLSAALLPFALLLSPAHVSIILMGLFVLTMVAVAVAPKDIASVHAEEKLATHHHYVARKRLSSLAAIRRLNPASSMLLLLNLAGGIFYGVIWFTVPIVLAHQAASGLMSIGLGVFDFSVVVLGFVLGSLADRVDKRTLVFFGLLIFSIFAMLLGLGFGLLFILFGFLATAGEEMAGLSLWSWLHALDREHAHDGLISGVVNLFSDLGWTIGPILAGFLYVLVGPSWTIVVGALPIFIVWISYLLFFRTHQMAHLPLTHIPKKPHRPRHKS